MEIRQLEYFNMVCKLKSFTHAAMELHVSQPSITNSIHKLEEELGVQLLKRNTRYVVPTPKGELFNQRVTHILSSIEEASTEIRETGIVTVKMGLPPMIGSHLFPSVFNEFHKTQRYFHLRKCRNRQSIGCECHWHHIDHEHDSARSSKHCKGTLGSTG